jgi:choline dehydrogenase-like flavoprotein
VTPTAYGDGTGTFHPDELRIERGAALRGRGTIRADACVIGSGAGGAVVAKELAEGGMDVVVLEEGEWWDTADFDARPGRMTQRLYRDAGQTATLGTPPIALPLGRAVGGTTLVNSGTCFRTPSSVLARWRADHGLEELTDEHLDPFARRVEEILNVVEVPGQVAGANAAVVRRGVERLGWSGGFLRRNVRGCVGSGVCAFGCPTGAKQHVGITYLPRAWAAGATTWTGARVTQLHVAGRRLRAVEARTQGGGALRVQCDHAIVACGAVHTPLLLRASRLATGSGELGRNLSIHPATAVRALFDEPIDPWNGVPQSYYVDELAGEGVMLEGVAGPPDYVAMALGRTGAEHREQMASAREMAQFGVMVSDTSRGRVVGTGAGGRILARRAPALIRYDLNERDTRAFQRGFEALTEIFWAAGARAVILPVARLPILRHGDSTPLRTARLRARDLELMAFHPLGTARAGADPQRSVVDPDLGVHGLEGLHVADGSVVPSALGVNPQITIMTLATRLAAHLLGGRLGDEARRAAARLAP